MKHAPRWNVAAVAADLVAAVVDHAAVVVAAGTTTAVTLVSRANRGGEDLIAEQPKSNGIAKRLRKNKESAPGTIVMKTVVCPQCGEQFAIGHKQALQDPQLASRQATWLQDQFVWDHIQENKHQASIRLPGLDEMK
jgi:hypothetical protein